MSTSSSTSRSTSTAISSSTSSTISTSSAGSTNTSLVGTRKRILELVNEQRSLAGVILLNEDSRLDQAAQAHAEDMKKNKYFSHVSLDGKTFTARIRATGYPLTGRWYAGENIAQGQTTPELVMASWMKSSGHKANILNKNYRDIGIGFYQNYWVQDFASHEL